MRKMTIQPVSIRIRLVIKNVVIMKSLFWMSMLAFLIFSCTSKDCCVELTCEYNIITDGIVYDNGIVDSGTKIKNVGLNGNCLEVEFQYGGGCAEHEIQLVWNGALAESFPPQAWLKVIHDNQDPCDALLTKTYSYDLSEAFTKPVILHLDGWEEDVRYE